MNQSKMPDQSVDPIVGKLFGLITSQLEAAHEISIGGHRSDKGLEQLQSVLDGLHVHLADIGTVIQAIELLIKSNKDPAP